MVKYGTIPYMRARLTYVPVEVADQFDDFIIQRGEQVLDTVKARTKDFSTLSLLKLLYQVKTKEMSFSELYSKSNIRMKKSFLNYLHLCINYNFLEKNAVGPNMIYSITEKGQTMLELFIQKKSN
jgi:predicted transcriptional regulator|tara:strand:+ start:3205 stop:3579 length:375 start_codon:yes stop_codon:yes gene_type:complete